MVAHGVTSSGKKLFRRRGPKGKDDPTAQQPLKVVAISPGGGGLEIPLPCKCFPETDVEIGGVWGGRG